ncbi:MAG: tetratricopeptide repeat protein [Bryobacteraceae bacterium]
MARLRLILIAAVLGTAISLAQNEHADKAAGYVQRGDLKSAEAELRKAVELSPSDPALLTSLGGILGMEGDLRQAHVYLAKAAKLNPADPLIARNLAANEWQTGRFREARERLEPLVKSNPGDRQAVFLLGMVSENERNYARAISLLESIPDIVDRQPEALVALASSYYHSNRPAEGETVLQKLLRGPVRPQVTFQAGRVALDARDYVLAENLLYSIRSTHPDPASVNALLAQAEYRQGHAAEAEKILADAVHSGHSNLDADLLFCKVLADRGAFENALQIAGAAAQSHPDSYQAFLTQGAMQMKLRYYADAAHSLQKAATIHPSAETQRELAVAEWRAGDRQNAGALFDQTMRQFPRDAQTFQAYGTVLLEDASPENQSRAANLLEKALANDGTLVEARLQLANLALAGGKPEAALHHLEKALATDANDSRLHFALSRVYGRLGRDADADREMQTYQRLKK